ncbi:nitroreductase family protein [Rothia nasimurium]|uniref:nitroreductase family protein n=1 Tax=Rothia nasimurium TaxID=85336 RepID=UPI00235161AE|nr:nitroreductase family protein [Rothia nasimurium]
MNYILEIARLSPSSVGAQGWRFVVLQNPEIREALKPFSWGCSPPARRRKPLHPAPRQPQHAARRPPYAGVTRLP